MVQVLQEFLIDHLRHVLRQRSVAELQYTVSMFENA